MAHEDGRKLSRSAQDAVRRKAVKAVVEEGKNPDQLRLPGLLWTRDLVGELIHKRFGVNLSSWTVGRYIERWGLTPQKPAKRALEQNPAQVKYWLETKYPAIERQAKDEALGSGGATKPGCGAIISVGQPGIKRGGPPWSRSVATDSVAT